LDRHFPRRRVPLGHGKEISVNTVLLFAGAAIMVGTAVITSSRYGDLPETIPIHFGLDGTANGYGPRSMAWLLVVNQVVIATIFFAIYVTTDSRGALVMGVCMLAIFLRVQLLILSAAITAKRAPVGESLLFILVVVAIGIFSGTRH
jgi:uncharacterized membrane protein